MDTGDEFDFIPAVDKQTLALAFGETLIHLLESLSEPLIPWALHGDCANATSRDMAFAVRNAVRKKRHNLIALVQIIHEMTSYSASVSLLPLVPSLMITD